MQYHWQMHLSWLNIPFLSITKVLSLLRLEYLTIFLHFFWQLLNQLLILK